MGLRGPAPKPTAIEIVEGRPGRRPINQREPVFSIVSAMRERELKLLREFGLTPASRTRVSTVRDDGRFDALEAALCG